MNYKWDFGGIPLDMLGLVHRKETTLVLGAKNIQTVPVSKFSLASQTLGGKGYSKDRPFIVVLLILSLYFLISYNIIPLYSVRITLNIDHWIKTGKSKHC